MIGSYYRGRMAPTPSEIVTAMFDKDAASQMLGMRLVEAAEGRAVVSMVVRQDMVNGLDVCHGGLIFSLADSAMAFASNAYNQFAIAVHADIDWVSPGRLGATLTATATEIERHGRNAIHNVAVTDQTGATVAVFRGRTRTIEGRHIG